MGEVAYLFGGAGHDRTCDHPVYSWVDPSTSLKPFAQIRRERESLSLIEDERRLPLCYCC